VSIHGALQLSAQQLDKFILTKHLPFQTFGSGLSGLIHSYHMSKYAVLMRADLI
jgi:hypothetical protein